MWECALGSFLGTIAALIVVATISFVAGLVIRHTSNTSSSPIPPPGNSSKPQDRSQGRSRSVEILEKYEARNPYPVDDDGNLHPDYFPDGLLGEDDEDKYNSDKNGRSAKQSKPEPFL